MNPGVEPVNPAKLRRFIWAILLTLGGLQAWTARFYATPDGMSYIDLSDGITHGDFGQLLNAYWSPLYPALLGVLRLVLRPGPYWEYAIPHVLNLLLFAASIAAFEYFLSALRAPESQRDSTLETIGAYAVFGVLSLTMMPLALPTPDLLVSAASFLVFGALLRLRRATDPRRAAIMLGIALVVGSLTESFVVPWAGVCLIVAWLATRQRWGARPALVGAAIWLVAIVPWSVALSLKMGHPTFGDTGRLTHVWYVNQVESPSDQLMPHAAATPATDSILPGVAITPNAPGTNPVWYDPARWYTDLRPRFAADEQVKVFAFLVAQYVSSLAPLLLLLWFCLAVARRDERRVWWRRDWVVIVPCIAAIGAYSLVLVTARYVAPFYVAITLSVLMGIRWPSRLLPGRVAVAIGVPLAVIAVSATTGNHAAVTNAAAGSVLFIWMARRFGTAGMIVSGILGAMLVRVLQVDAAFTYLMLTVLMVVGGYWLAARRALGNEEGVRFGRVVHRGLFAATGLLMLAVGGFKFRTGLDQQSISPSEPNDHWLVAGLIRKAGIAEGERIAIVGSPFDAYWARTARLKFVAVVPPLRMAAYRALGPAQRERLFGEFARAGATRVVVQQLDSPAPGDRSWVVLPYVGWARRLTPR